MLSTARSIMFLTSREARCRFCSAHPSRRELIIQSCISESEPLPGARAAMTLMVILQLVLHQCSTFHFKVEQGNRAEARSAASKCGGGLQAVSQACGHL